MPKKQPVQWEIPFDKQTGMVVRTCNNPKDPQKELYIWKPRDYWFTSVLRFVGGTMFVDLTTNSHFWMFDEDFNKFINNNTLIKGIISGNWSFRKHGQEYGIVFSGVITDQ